MHGFIGRFWKYGDDALVCRLPLYYIAAWNDELCFVSDDLELCIF